MDENMMAGEPGEAPEQGGQAGYCIELCVTPDGQMTIAVEPLGGEMGEEQGEPTGTPVNGLRDALAMIMTIVKNNGQMANEQAGEDEFNAGYGEGSNSTAPEVAKRFM